MIALVKTTRSSSTLTTVKLAFIQIATSILFSYAASASPLTPAPATGNDDRQIKVNFNLNDIAGVDPKLHQILTYKLVQDCFQSTLPIYDFSEPIKKHVFERAMSDFTSFIEFDRLVKRAMAFHPWTPPNPPQTWHEAYFSNLSELILQAQKDNLSLEDYDSFFSFLVTSKQLNFDTLALPSAFAATHAHDPHFTAAFISLGHTFAAIEAKKKDYPDGYFYRLVHLAHAIYTVSAKTPSPEVFASLVDQFKKYAEFNPEANTADLMVQMASRTSEIEDNTKSKVYEKFMAGTYTDNDFYLLEKDFTQEPLPELNDAIRNLSSQPEKQKRLALDYYNWLLKNRPHYQQSFLPKAPAVLQVLFENADEWLSDWQVESLIKKSFTDLFRNEKLKEVAKGYIEGRPDAEGFVKTHWQTLRRIANEEFHNGRINQSFNGPLFGRQVFILENMNYVGSEDQDAIIELFVSRAEGYQPEVKNVYFQLFKKVNDPRKVKRWKKALSIRMYDKRDEFLNKSVGPGRCAVLMNKALPGVFKLPPAKPSGDALPETD